MAIRNIINDQNKSWLDVNFNTLNSKQIDVLNGNIINLNAGSILRLQGNAGASGNIVQKDGSNNPAWVSTLHFGDRVNFDSDEVSVFTTDTGAWAAFPFQFQYLNLAPGDYFIYWSMEIKNTTGRCLGRVIDTAVTVYNEWAFNDDFIDIYSNCSGIYPFTVAGPATESKVFEFEIKSVTPASTTSARRFRFMAFRTN